MDRTRRIIEGRHRWQLVLTVVVVVLAAAACASAGSAASAAGGEQNGAGPEFGSAARAPEAAATAAAAPGDATSKWQDAHAPADNAPLDQQYIVKTGQLTLEVPDLDKALSQAQATIVGMGGYVAQTSKSGTGASATAAITYRIPAQQWDAALAAIEKLAGKVLSEQSASTDVGGQVVDLEARLTNLQATERALQAIMAKADKIPDILSVEQQLSQTQGQIEELTAQRDHLKDQAAMSTLAVAYQLPGTPPVTTAARDWNLSAEVDQALAALVRLGQGLATLLVWAAIVIVPIGICLLVLLAIVLLVLRRILPLRSAVAAPQHPEA